MPKTTLSSYLREHLDGGPKKTEPGPYITISRQYGCDGEEIGIYLAEKLNEREEQKQWKVYNKEFIQQLSEDTGTIEEILERECVSKPSLFKDFLRGLNKNPVPDRVGIRNEIARMMRMVAINGHSILIGQGGAAATSDIANGLTLRLEAPREWRIARVCRQDSLEHAVAEARIEQFETEQRRLRKYYDQNKHRIPEFHLILDNSVFSIQLVAQLVLKAMEEKGMIEKSSKI
ncbi:MAG: cytidylate kinase-like family protein [Phycisphaerae bacterium]|jgi:cytidylate kinase|nr:cytidylate kinase-like family protein [Phycisphaerae bacterium]